MRVQFEFTEDDLVDVYWRVFKRAPQRKALRRNRVITVVVFVVLLFAAIPGDTTIRLIGAIAGLAVTALLYRVLDQRFVKQSTRQFWRENSSGEQTAICEVELQESGVHTYQLGREFLFPWKSIVTIQETNNGIELNEENGGLVVVRKRAFSNPTDQARFVETATRFLNSAS